MDYKHNRLLGRHCRLIPVSRGTRTANAVSLRPPSKVRDPQQPDKRNHLRTQDHLPRLQGLRRGFQIAGRTNKLSTGLPPSPNRQSAPPFSEYTEFLQAISAQRGGTPSTNSQTSLRPQNKGLSPHHLDTGIPHGLRVVQGEFATRQSTDTPRPTQATCSRHRCLHSRPGGRAATTRPEPLASPHLLEEENQPRDETNSCTTTTFNRSADATLAVSPPTVPPPPVART